MSLGFKDIALAVTLVPVVPTAPVLNRYGSSGVYEAFNPLEIEVEMEVYCNSDFQPFFITLAPKEKKKVSVSYPDKSPAIGCYVSSWYSDLKKNPNQSQK